ncbi:hypothetical protein MLD52_14165 [Puniceicoccaceae bacterium K14]|nr:hypothetical protein [Puniceicoccaceae bacterium K14]
MIRCKKVFLSPEGIHRKDENRTKVRRSEQRERRWDMRSMGPKDSERREDQSFRPDHFSFGKDDPMQNERFDREYKLSEKHSG